MTRERIAALLEKYWQADTTVEEEKELAEYFRGSGVPPEWEPYREIFSFFALEAQVKPGEFLVDKIMERVRPPRYTGWWAAAAVLILGLGLFLVFRPAPVRDMPPVAKHAAQPARDVAIKDTYEDPQQALAAVKKALFTASEKMNKGRKIVAN
jgi:hypothetical protein